MNSRWLVVSFVGLNLWITGCGGGGQGTKARSGHAARGRSGARGVGKAPSRGRTGGRLGILKTDAFSPGFSCQAIYQRNKACADAFAAVAVEAARARVAERLAKLSPEVRGQVAKALEKQILQAGVAMKLMMTTDSFLAACQITRS